MRQNQATADCTAADYRGRRRIERHQILDNSHTLAAAQRWKLVTACLRRSERVFVVLRAPRGEFAILRHLRFLGRSVGLYRSPFGAARTMFSAGDEGETRYG